MSIGRTFAGVVVGMMLLPAVAHTSFAQQLEPMAASSRMLSTEGAFTPSAESQVPLRPAHMWAGVAGGIAGGAAGFVGGIALGAEIGSHHCHGEECSLPSAIVGSVIGESLALAVGAHYGSRGRGDLGLQILTSAAIGAAGVYGAWYAGRAAPVILLGVPVVQLLAVLAMEK